jgi:hypothetical protein
MFDISEDVRKTGGFLDFFKVISSTLLHLPPLRLFVSCTKYLIFTRTNTYSIYR